jgi:NTE family protein
MMRGLALEGGGARGAYHIGVAKALMESGYTFDGYVGTSIGAINAASLAQDDINKTLYFWEHITMEQMFDAETLEILKKFEIKGLKSGNDERLSNIKKILTDIKNGGISTYNMRNHLQANIDEEKIRCSGKDFGLVTISLKDRKPYELMLENIPNGQLLNYIMASASYPLFQKEKIGEEVFLDGAFYDNCPYKLLVEKGYDEIIVVRTNSMGIFHKVKDNHHIKVISPQIKLGRILSFSPESSKMNIKAGYADGLDYVQKNPRIFD